MIQHIKENDILSFDVESNSLNTRKGQIIGFSVCGSALETYYLPTKTYNVATDQLDEFLIEGVPGDKIAVLVLDLLVGKKLIMHNGSFDCRFVQNYYGIDLLPSLWIETLLLLHTIMEEGVPNIQGPFSLKIVASHFKDRMGIDPDKLANEEQIELKENIKKNGGSVSKTNLELYKADTPVLGKYGAADTDLTYRLAFALLVQLIEEDLVEFFFEEEVMPLYREVTVPMEQRGVRLGLDKLHSLHAEIATVQNDLKQEVIDSLLKLPQFKAWCITQALENHPPSNRGGYAQRYCETYNIPLPKSKSGKYSLTAKAVEALPDSEHRNFLITGNCEKTSEGHIPQSFMAISLEMWKQSNDGVLLNIQSKKQLSEIVFDFLGEKPLSTTKKGTIKFDEDVIEHLSPKYAWCESLRKYNKLQKIKSAYIERFLEGEEDGRFYFYFKQHGTVSGRYGSDAQQLPRPLEEGDEDPLIVKYVNEIRTFFIADEGRSFVDCDYESLEPHVFAHVSGDEKLKDVFRKGHDFYSTIAINAENLHHLSADKTADNYLKKVDPSKRQRAKPYALGIPYGMKEFRLANTLNISKDEAKKIISNYLTNFSQLAKWMKDSDNYVKAHGKISTEVGRVRHLPIVKQLYESVGDKIFDWNFRATLGREFGKEQTNKLFYSYVNGLNNSHNFQIQSLAASIVNRAAIAVTREFKKQGIDGWVCAQIHDQLVFDVADEDVERAAPIVQHCMENTTKLSLPLKAEPQIGQNFKDAH